MSTDLIIRSTGATVPLRFIVADLTQTVNAIGAMHKAEAWALAQLGETIIASAFLSAGLKTAGTVSVTTNFSGDLSFIQADTTPMGLCRATLNQDEVLKVGDFELLLSPQVMSVRKLNEHAKQIWEGIVGMESTSMGRNLALYLLNSEQIRSGTGIHAKPLQSDATKLEYAIGFYIEAFPDAKEEHLIIMEEVVRNLPPMDSFMQGGVFNIRALLDQVAGPVEYQIHKEITPKAYCPCSMDRTLGMLSSLSITDLQDLSANPQEFEIICDFCRTPYLIPQEEVQKIILDKKAKEN
jgi:molecular chaperone Hsp33